MVEGNNILQFFNEHNLNFDYEKSYFIHFYFSNDEKVSLHCLLNS